MPNWTECDVCGTIYYERTGSNKPPVVLVHGLSDSGECWQPVIDILQQEYEIMTWDAPGHGRSDVPRAGYTLDRYLDTLHDLILSLNIDKPILIGHSMGGLTASRLAARHPDIARAVILEDPAWNLDPSPQTTSSTFNWVTWIRDLQSHTYDEVVAIGHASHPGWSDAELQPWARAKLAFKLELFDVAPPARQEDWRETLASITCPILLITGEPQLGAIVTAEAAHEASMCWKEGKVVHIAGAGHNIRREQFTQYMDAVQTFLQEQQ